MKIYTKKGDQGETSLPKKGKVSKTSAIIEALGTLDECNATIGLALAFIPENQTSCRQQLTEVQRDLLDIGAAIAAPEINFQNQETEKLEAWIDEMEKELPPMKDFVLPGGNPATAALHLARTVCRRAERRVVPLDCSKALLVYLNRLSDYLFVAAGHIL